MRIVTLDIAGFRNLRRWRMECSSGLNLLIGPNASGKTSLLEALYFLGRGRSFRTRQPRELIQIDAPFFRLVAILQTGDGQQTSIGLERNTRELTAHIDGVPTHSLAELVRRTPVLLLNPDSHRLLEDGPQQRRRFMDWGLFHAEPEFFGAWRRYSAALRHRNAALRSGATNRVVDAWDSELAAAAILDRLRGTFCEALQGVLRRFIEETLVGVAVQVDYRRGWPLEPPERDFSGWLRAGRDQDRQQGYTRLGPHRADFMMRIDGRPPSEALSRGQQKLLVIALVLAQAELYRHHVGDACMLLIDDLPAELDLDNRVRVMRALAALDTQSFITAIEPGLLDATLWREARTFHLLRGELAAN
ncbi:MAG: DNA replication/repair protein RecF [Gammaproteobacteria bacterium]|nr:DNA replication/repair protein RecF [Gammaproteobacteria bacterium]MCP5195751.1 DNA replication/repair protein RecF [Gammaproteobacteria bacterium]